jgi:pyridoxine/pyridoxamine 5'-phosphate oxidase
MTRDELLSFLRRHRYAVQASARADGAPQAAVIGIAVSDQLEIVFDTLGGSRKGQNLRRDPRVALVIGWEDEQTVQVEGVADEPSGEELARLKAVYFARFPDGLEREQWADIAYFRVRPTWARYSDFRPNGAVVEVPL